MYKIKRKENLIDTLQFENSKGEKLTIEVKINLLEKINSYQKAYRAVEISQIEIQKGSKDMRKLGNAIIDVIEVVFGEDNGKKMITFYDGDYAELLIDLWPFIVNKVHPAFIKAKKQREKEIKENIKKL